MRLAILGTLITVTALTTGCGGGDGGGGSTTGGGSTGGGSTGSGGSSGMSRGTAASGIALGSAAITAKCRDGSTYSSTASVDGSFSITITASTYPCLLQAAKGGSVLRSVALAEGVVNITPLTDMVVAKLGAMPSGDYFAAFPSGATVSPLSAANVAAAQAAVRTALGSIANLALIPDLITTPFTAASPTSSGDNIDKAIDAVSAGLTAKGLTPYTVMTAMARGTDAATIQTQISSGSADALAGVPFASQWIQGRVRSGAGGGRLARIDGGLHSYKYGGAYGSGWMVSQDNGTSWQQRFAPISPQLITSFNGRLIATGEYFSYVSSSDGGQTWESIKRFPDVPSKYDNYSNGADCLVQSSGKLFAKAALASDAPLWVSTDGRTFELAGGTDINTFNNALGNSGTCNGVLPTAGPQNLLSVAGSPVVVGGSKYFRQSYTTLPVLTDGRSYNYLQEISSNGTTWTPIFIATNLSAEGIYEVAPGRFIAIGWRENDAAFRGIRATYLSIDGGVTWTDVGGGPAIQSFVTSVASIGNNIVAVGSDGLITRSANGGTAWTDVMPANTANASLGTVAGGNNVFVAAGGQGSIFRSADGGATWTQQPSGTTEDFRAIAYGNGKFIAITASGKVLASADGTSWASIGVGLTAFGPLQYRIQIAYGDGVFIAAVAPGACIGDYCAPGNTGVFYSHDGGVTWSRSSLGEASGATYGDGTFMALAYGATWISTDRGQTWAKKGIYPGVYCAQLAYGKGTFACAESAQDPNTKVYMGGIWASLDGGWNWKFYQVNGGAGEYLTYTGSRWVGVGQRNVVVTSSP